MLAPFACLKNGLFGFFFSRNIVFLSQQFSRNSIFQPVSAKFQTSERGLRLHRAACPHRAALSRAPTSTARPCSPPPCSSPAVASRGASAATRAAASCGRRWSSTSSCRPRRPCAQAPGAPSAAPTHPCGARSRRCRGRAASAENNPDYECLRAELRRMAPPNGRAVLLFRNRCGCPVAKLEGWGAPKSKRRNKK